MRHMEERITWAAWISFLLYALAAMASYFHVCSAVFIPADNYMLACGSLQNVSFQGQVYVPDSQQSSISLRTSGDGVISTSNADVPSPIYKSLRIFSEPASYEFDIRQPGRHWIRLYFYPLSNSGHDLISAPLTVVTDDMVLINNFTFKNSNHSDLFKEYSLNVTSDSLALTFIPSNNSVSFVNGIEVVSVPDELISDQVLAIPNAPFSGLSTLALETKYRLNMGGPLLTPQNDSLGRTWETDGKYLHVNSSAVKVSVDPSAVNYPAGVTAETAPRLVYSTADAMGDPNVTDLSFNITWVFSVDPSFLYLVRLHFCDIVSKSLNTLVFNVYINSDIAIASLDLSSLKGDLSVPYYKDFVSNSSNASSTLTVSVGPDSMADYSNAILNGLEIMKMSNQVGSLDGLNSVGDLRPQSRYSSKSRIWIILGVVLGILVAVALAAVCYYCCFVVRRSKTNPHSHPWLPLPLYGNSHTISKVSTTSHRSGTASCISLASTNLGRAFTFQEIIDATNKFDESFLLGVGGFGKVYKGTLEDGTKVAVKRGNPSFIAKVADFGLSKTGPALIKLMSALLSKEALATFDPGVLRRQQLTDKSDVYSFGVVLMEVLCARPALNPVLPREQVNIAEWGMSWQKKGMLEQIMDPSLVGKINPASLRKYGETAEKCLAEQGVDRPTMGDVLWNLEYALQLEETSALVDPDENSTNNIPGIQLTQLEPFDNSVSMVEGINSGTDEDAEDAATSAVFSQLVNPRGR
ncbi:hypothetical protein J5N97_011961 [Dioscorea zingiberensis]|uniref:Protein kinase domain-containing protein n=1 Tax=Dioscorea zingiberensis TaxID=325984 RepID=A0A9D5D1G6_9LILI|nr:hypothetical protein J5N97_011961 [Dioscorea zingiberensis]